MKIEKLELKHYAPYLAHEVLVRTPDQYGEIPDEFKMTVDNIDIIEANSFRMLLRPISDLAEKSLIDELWYGIVGTDSDCFDKDEFIELCELGLVNQLPFMVVQKLFELHIDAFGLIPPGLALPKK